ncbi:tyrosine-type recombinase/integrase [Kitasatospora sp. NPDC004614]|uniref:tyrosine-type recombinase/integrase n=1 Tax=unclassified Kitasatospora TaxID=2633591 RepID=UPI0036A460DB
MARYRAYVTNDLIPAIGNIRLDDLGYPHIAGLVHAQLAHGRGRVTVHQILATLSSALGDAVRHHRLATNPARPTVIPRPAAAERRIWTTNEAVRFLRYCHAVDPPFADLIELLVGTGMRKGEALGLHWNDVHLDHGVLFVRYSLAAVDNNHLLLTTPKTRTSKNWVAISPRVATALHNRADDRAITAAGAPGGGLVFHRPDGRPLHPEYVLNHFHDLSRGAGVSRTTVHDLRHLAATISITAGVPLTVVSKTLRHSTLSTTANIYSHLTTQAARDAVDTIGRTLTTVNEVDIPTGRIPRPRPPSDHNPPLHNQLTRTKRAEGAANCRNPDQPPQNTATTMRPQVDGTTERPLPPEAETASDLQCYKSGRQDLNLRPLDPQRPNPLVPNGPKAQYRLRTRRVTALCQPPATRRR